MIFSNFFNLPKNVWRPFVDFLSVTDLSRLFLAQPTGFQLNTLIVLLETGKTKNDINIITVLLAILIQQRELLPVNFQPLNNALEVTLQSTNTTLTHQLLGKFLLSGKTSLPYSEQLSSNLEIMLNAMSTHPELADVVPFFLIAGDEKTRKMVAEKLEAFSLPEEYRAKWRLLFEPIKDRSSHKASRNIYKTSHMDKFWHFSSEYYITRQANQTATRLLSESRYQHFPKRIRIELMAVWDTASDRMRQIIVNTLLTRANDHYNSLPLYYIDATLTLCDILDSLNGGVWFLKSNGVEGFIQNLLELLTGNDQSIDKYKIINALSSIFVNQSVSLDLSDRVIKTVYSFINQSNTPKSLCEEAARNLSYILATNVPISNNIRLEIINELITLLNNNNDEALCKRTINILKDILIDEPSWNKIKLSAIHAIAAHLPRLLILVGEALGKIGHTCVALEFPNDVFEKVIHSLIERLEVESFDHNIAYPLGDILTIPELSNEIRQTSLNKLLEKISSEEADTWDAVPELGIFCRIVTSTLPQTIRQENFGRLIAQLTRNQTISGLARNELCLNILSLVQPDTLDLSENTYEAAANRLLEQCNDTRYYVRQNSACILQHILSFPTLDPEIRKRGVKRLLAALKDTEDDVCQAAASALTKILTAGVIRDEHFLTTSFHTLLQQNMANPNERLLDVFQLCDLLHANVTLPEPIRKATLIAFFERLNKQSRFYEELSTSERSSLITSVFDKILDQIKSPSSTAQWSEETKADIVTELLKLESEISLPYLLKFIFWDKTMRAFILNATSDKADMLNAMIHTVEACESKSIQTPDEALSASLIRIPQTGV